MITLIYLVLSGLISGIFGGMGMGGGTLLIPILTIFLDFKQKSAQGINLLVFIPMSIVALIIHMKNKLVDFKVGIPIMCSGVVFSFAGSLIANSISNNNLRKFFGAFLLIVGIYQGLQVVLGLKKKKSAKLQKSKFKFRIYYK